MPRRLQTSAGLLAYRRRASIEVLLGHPGGPYWAKRDEGAWTIPKGVIETDLDLITAARLAFTEETGFVASGAVMPLQPVRQKSGKVVYAWAFEGDFDLTTFKSLGFEMEWPPRSGQMQSFPEIDRICWFALAVAMEKLIPYQRPFLNELTERLAQDGTA
jgi:predicted NUDIX family NTP pyrophosphohydrolase